MTDQFFRVLGENHWRQSDQLVTVRLVLIVCFCFRMHVLTMTNIERGERRENQSGKSVSMKNK